jgi:hypothetical protein
MPTLAYPNPRATQSKNVHSSLLSANFVLHKAASLPKTAFAFPCGSGAVFVFSPPPIP